jgi:DNA repair protein RecN (Recombination protein N)
MIRCLHVRNLAIIKDATLDLGPGLNLLTGETGAGKSILVDALLIGLGARADTDLLRTGEERGSVQIEFEVGGNAAALEFLAAKGYETEGGVLVVSREIVPPGRSRAFIGGVLAPLADLRTLAALLLAIHGQHHHQVLLDPARHRDLLDRQAGLGPLLARMGEAAAALAEASARLDSMRDGAQRLAQRIDMLRWQVQEIDAAGLHPDERASLRTERDMLRNAESVLNHGRGALDALYDGEGSALARLAEGVRAAREVARYDTGLGEDLARVEAARAEIEEMAYRLRDFVERLSPDPERLQAVDDRLQLLEALQRKYAPGGDENSILGYRAAAAAELQQLTGGGESVADLERRVQALREAALEVALELSRRRRAAAAGLEHAIEAGLGEMAMPGTRFAIDFRHRASPGSGLWVEGEEVAVDGAGCDVVEFLLSANRGEALRPLAAVASGGELSRIMLALEVVLLGSAAARTLVFDEVDAGIGGAVAEVVGRKLKALAKTHQVLCVTHLAPIATLADRHVRVAKKVARGRTEVVIEPLDGAGRVREVARMLAGETVTPTALKHAADMLERAGGRPAPPARG